MLEVRVNSSGMMDKSFKVTFFKFFIIYLIFSKGIWENDNRKTGTIYFHKEDKSIRYEGLINL